MLKKRPKSKKSIIWIWRLKRWKKPFPSWRLPGIRSEAAVSGTVWEILYRALAEVTEDKREVYQKAITAYESALQYYTIDRYPKEFAVNTMRIGITYKAMAEMIKNYVFDSINEYNEFRADRLLNAMGAFQGALTVFTIEKYPYDYAMVRFSMGETYAMLAELQEREENLAKALASLEEALKIFTPADYPAGA